VRHRPGAQPWVEVIDVSGHLITSGWTFVFESDGIPRSEQRSYKYLL
jgi:hypothetical protein